MKLPAKKLIWGVLWVILAIAGFIFVMVCAYSDIGFAQSVKFKSVSIRDGWNSYNLKGKSLAESAPYLKQQTMAQKAGIDLMRYLDKKVVYGVRQGQFYILFYDLVSAFQCKRSYLLQRVKLEKINYRNQQELERKNEYLVEAFRIDQFKNALPDEHYKQYGLGGFDEREIILEAEIGCGEIPGVVGGHTWPYESNKVYHLLQDYSPTPKDYDAVKFEFSSKYRLRIYFNNKDELSVDLPDFLK